MDPVEWDVSYVQQFNSVYHRNNREDGLKILYCFPCCAPTGHPKRGTCGGDLEIRCKLPSAELGKEIRCVGYIKKEISALLAKVGGSVTNSELERLLNLDVFEDRYLREAACEVVGDELSIRFPGSVKTPVGKVGWNYNWNSQRFLAHGAPPEGREAKN